MTMWYTPVGGLDFYLGIFGGLALVVAALYSPPTAKAAAVWMGTMLCLYSLFDFYTDLGGQAEATDAGILANYWVTSGSPTRLPQSGYCYRWHSCTERCERSFAERETVEWERTLLYLGCR